MSKLGGDIHEHVAREKIIKMINAKKKHQK